ncbi:MAG: TIGR02147 family protein [Fibrobacterota bacterium]|nr:TIGR02147 family protein [Fibrobacterota bacterium]QQS06015.1 MAG: TIGR02147 family protein [Fibrobacterota bacterium]
MPEIFTYTDYRKFLSDAWAERKARDAKFSHRFIALRAGFASSGFFSKILSGDVNLTPSGALKLAEIFRLSNRETRYFELLVLYDQARSHEERMLFLDRIVASRNLGVPELETSKTAFCRDWRAVAVLQALDLIEHRDDHALLGRMLTPKVEAAEVGRILALLDELGLAAKGDDGIWRKTQATLTTGDAESEAIDLFRQTTMELGIESMDRWTREDRSISTLTLSVSRQTFERLRDKLRCLRREALDMASSDDLPDRVIQVNFQMFPLAVRPEGGES